MRRFQALLAVVFVMGIASLGGVSACAQDREDVFIPPPSEEEAKREKLPEELKEVLAEWSYDDDGKIIGVNFDAGSGFFKRRMGPEDIESLSKLTHLRRLTVYSKSITDDSLKSLGKLTKLKELHLTMCKITSKGVAHLKPLQNLVVLDLSDTEIDDEAMKVVAKLEKLEVLDLTETWVSDFGVAELYQHEKLRKLKLGSGSGLKNELITDDSIGALSNIKSLRELYISGTSISGTASIRRAIPEIDIDRD